MNCIKNIFVTCLTIVVLFSTLSLSVHKHFCGPFLKDVSVVLPSHGCGMEKDTVQDSCAGIKVKNCCNDVVEIVKGQEDLKLSCNDYHLKHQQFLIAFTSSYYHIFKSDTPQSTRFTYYTPPLVTHDMPVLYQSFLI
jgi:hypothetical protein